MSGTHLCRAARRALAQSPARTCVPGRLLPSSPVHRIAHQYAQVSAPHSRSAYRRITTSSLLRREQPPSDTQPPSSDPPPPKQYTFEDIDNLTQKPHPNRIIIDVREPSELQSTGRIPTAKSVPLSSGPDAFFMPADDFEAKFGFARPGQSDEVIFYCKAGVRSRQACVLASQAQPSFGGRIGNYGGSWLDWEKHGGKVEREGDQ